MARRTSERLLLNKILDKLTKPHSKVTFSAQTRVVSDAWFLGRKARPIRDSKCDAGDVYSKYNQNFWRLKKGLSRSGSFRSCAVHCPALSVPAFSIAPVLSYTCSTGSCNTALGGLISSKLWYVWICLKHYTQNESLQNTCHRTKPALLRIHLDYFQQ